MFSVAKGCLNSFLGSSSTLVEEEKSFFGRIKCPKEVVILMPVFLSFGLLLIKL